MAAPVVSLRRRVRRVMQALLVLGCGVVMTMLATPAPAQDRHIVKGKELDPPRILRMHRPDGLPIDIIRENGQGNSPANASTFGTTSDPLVGQRVGGINVLGGGLVLYQGGVRVGGLGVSGDTSCTDHMVAWRTRNALGLDHFGVVGSNAALTVTGDLTHPDNIIFDVKPNPNGGTGISTSGFGHPTCLNNPTAAAVSGLPPVTH
jgi:Haem-degrading